ncbi:MAG TPA: zf-TFIIB domain-containing protein [Thermoanaerobaculia bacterium]|nr:zf-TFIIB domain-containing protein [Thermoanaerobaculia bacterium]
MSEWEKPSKAEDEYFARQELERRKQWATEQRSNMAESEKTRLRELHYMKCPKCGMDLVTIDLHGVKIDRCVSCHGTFFDDGELEQVLQRGGGFLNRIGAVFRGSKGEP